MNRILQALVLVTSLSAGCQPRNTQSDIAGSSLYKETDQNLLKLPDGSIVYINHSGNAYALNQVKDGQSMPISTFSHPVFFPFLYNGETAWLTDSCGNELYTSSKANFNRISGNTIDRIYTSNTGRYLIYKKTDEGVFLFDQQTQCETLLEQLTNEFTHLAFDPTDSIASYKDGDDLFILHLPSAITGKLAVPLSGEKFNPCPFAGKIYFACRDTAQFTAIYSCDLSSSEISKVHQTSNELRLPTVTDTSLYFIEIINSQYLLRRKSLTSGKVDQITDRGVVYTYIPGEKQVYYSYADINSTKSLYSYRLDTRTSVPIDSITLFPDLEAKPYVITPGDTVHYQISSNKAISRPGTILFIHPGLHGDYSPRFEPLLYHLANAGYLIICPNYPGSKGYGYDYEHQNPEAAVEMLSKMAQQIRSQTSKPLYLLTSSSGNILAERLLNMEKCQFTAAVSLFGIPGAAPTPKVPVLYLLGENDQQINYGRRKEQLSTAAKKHPISIYSYPCEGHWFRDNASLQDASERIVNHFKRQD
ncbi:alpha/beta hydrolase [Chitinophaga agri]|uniref:DUF5050 domain-containing protein n=1 Tax=Chitinophaga agri TaxID=2703787 RepID=A0A6B9ZNI9_9BACT|nr:DUF5050 domain-containing protein [Chitinophaga agri]QHS63537.1 DUF5050 domain-containing protein [Chitinophaga agri]